MQEKKKNGEKSMVKFPIIEFDLKKVDSKEEKDPKKKVKPIMIDAWT